MDRRTLLKSGLAASGLLAASPAAWSAPAPAILTKAIPSSGEQIPAIGMGSWLTFDVAGNDRAVRQRTDVLRTFFDLGGSVIDSSPMYGSSQTVIGSALKALDFPKNTFSADKVWTGSSANGPQQIATSANRWGVDTFDLLQVHNLVAWQAHLETLLEMKAQGRLRYVGMTTYAGLKQAKLESIMTRMPLDFIQVTYNILDRHTENRTLPLAQERGLAVIANRPFRQGQLMDIFDRKPLPPIAAEINATNWAQFLLKFIISHPAITVAIPATRRVDHMAENMGALRGILPEEPMRRRMIEAVTDI